MARIIIELDDSAAKVSTPPSAGQQASSQPAAVSTAPPDLAARAAQIGALDGGPAPSLAGAQPHAAPLPHASPGAHGQAGGVSTSAGPAPESLFSSPKP